MDTDLSLKDKVTAALESLVQRYTDRRLYVADLVVEDVRSSIINLGGRILEQRDLDTLCAKLTAQFPGYYVEPRAVRVLRQPGNPVLAVGTNLTGLYAAPSFQSEMSSQAFSGERVEILEENDRWAFIRQEDGYLGYTFLPFLTGRIIPPPTHWISAPVIPLHASPGVGAPVVTRFLGGTAVHLQATQGDWANIASSRSGWVPVGALRPVDAVPAGETARREMMVQDALRLIGIPYLWGGISANGIDCSGFTRLVYRLAGFSLPRDADLQYLAGKPVEPPFSPGDLVFFGELSGKKRIAHVGISLGQWEIVHSSLSRNGVYADNIQAVETLRLTLVGGGSFF